MKYTKVDEIRFWSKVSVSQSNESCWYWQASKHKFGYGWHRILGKTYTSHRLALIFFTGEEKEGLHVLHNCNNPSCCNPLHLRWGTDLDNHLDAVNSGRHVPPPPSSTNPPVYIGSANYKAIMNEESVKCLRQDRAAGLSYSQLASKYQISISTVAQISNYKSWKHVQ